MRCWRDSIAAGTESFDSVDRDDKDEAMTSLARAWREERIPLCSSAKLVTKALVVIMTTIDGRGDQRREGYARHFTTTRGTFSVTLATFNMSHKLI
jgi:hypothetical protein